jgi:hypothetical protein
MPMRYYILYFLVSGTEYFIFTTLTEIKLKDVHICGLASSSKIKFDEGKVILIHAMAE